MHKFWEGMCFLFQQYCLHSSQTPHNYLRKQNKANFSSSSISLTHTPTHAMTHKGTALPLFSKGGTKEVRIGTGDLAQ